ncbi:MAG: DNA mismatch repair endonuclease MutL [Phycisphaerales bacterium]|nr:DNA mismatch repair endonuclease MutL [Phycisphaerales bacterium]
MAHRPIQQLSPSLVNRIAAGEVIERPASVVKELVENAIDAGASHIQVEVEEGGHTLIRVTDDGSGIPVAELPLAFASHATSKLTCDEDLTRIATMGFRGEALASIGAVSQAKILSRIPTEQAAYEIHNRGGILSDPQAAAGNVGTTIEIHHLFYNTPARRKFLRGAPTEYGYIAEMVLRLALPHPTIAFTLLHNGRKTLQLSLADPVDRLLDAWPTDFREQRLPLDVHDAEIHLHGIIGLPELARPTAKYQQLYLNGRAIRDKFMQHALREAYRGLTEPGRHPAAILLLEIPPADVDVNVHPTKMEVRFRDSGRIHGLVLSAVREKLLGSDLTPTAIPHATTFPAPPSSDRPDLQSRLASFLQQTLPSAPPLSSPPLPLSPSPNLPSSANPAIITDEPFSTPLPPPPSPTSAIQLHNSYLVAESPEGMIIIDQHALHERIMYEELRTRLTRGPLESQRLLIPLPLAVTTRQLALVDQIQPLLVRLGIELTPFGLDTLALHAFPSFLHRLEPLRFIQELLERGEQELLDLHDEELLHEVLDMMACKAAVKAGDPLSAAEIEALLSRRELVERSSNCPHGRPTTLRLSLKDLEKQFKRTGF